VVQQIWRDCWRKKAFLSPSAAAPAIQMPKAKAMQLRWDLCCV
jgi:hypothetical protein